MLQSHRVQAVSRGELQSWGLRWDEVVRHCLGIGSAAIAPPTFPCETERRLSGSSLAVHGQPTALVYGTVVSVLPYGKLAAQGQGTGRHGGVAEPARGDSISCTWRILSYERILE